MLRLDVPGWLSLMRMRDELPHAYTRNRLHHARVHCMHVAASSATGTSTQPKGHGP